MAEDVTVSFGADDSALSQAIAKIKASMTELDAKAIALGKTISEAFAKMGITQAAGFKLAGPEEQNALAQYWASMEKGTDATKKLTNATKELGQAGRQTGIDFGAMAERMAARLVTFEAIRLAIQGIKFAFDEIAKTEAAELRFTAMSAGVQHFSTHLEHLHDIARKTFTAFDETVTVEQKMQDMGQSILQAEYTTERLNEWAHVLNTTSDKLADSLEHVSKGAGTLAEKREVATMLGDSAQAGMQLVRTLESLEVTGPAVTRSLDAVIQSLETMNRAEHQTLDQFKMDMDDYERHLDRHISFTEKLARADEKAKQARAPRGTRVQTAEEELTQAFEVASRPGGRPPIIHGLRVPQSELDEYRRGLQAIASEEGISLAKVHQLIRDNVLSYRDVMQAAKESTSDELRQGDQKLRQDDKLLANAREENRLGKESRDARTAGLKAQVAQLPGLIGAPSQELLDAWKRTPGGQAAMAASTAKEAIDAGNKLLGQILDEATKGADAQDKMYALFAGTT